MILNYTLQFSRVPVVPLFRPSRTAFTIRLRANEASFSLSSIRGVTPACGWTEPVGPPNPNQALLRTRLTVVGFSWRSVADTGISGRQVEESLDINVSPAVSYILGLFGLVMPRLLCFVTAP